MIISYEMHPTKSLYIHYFGVCILLLFVIAFAAGCTGAVKTTPESPTGTSQPSGDRYWIHIDPISDFSTDAALNIIGSTQLEVRGTTNFPVGTMLSFAILEENRERDVIKTNIEVRSNSSGPNSFTVVYNMEGNPPGRYRVILADSINLYSAISRFNITSALPFPRWIQMDPLENIQKGKNIFISGTTNLTAGTEITVSYSMLVHSCVPPRIQDKQGERTFCGGSCHPGEGSSYTIRVVEGDGGVNSWNATLDTTGWCMEIYGIGVDAGNGTNALHTGQNIRFFGGNLSSLK
jgi:hypothetical protein